MLVEVEKITLAGGWLVRLYSVKRSILFSNHQNRTLNAKYQLPGLIGTEIFMVEDKTKKTKNI